MRESRIESHLVSRVFDIGGVCRKVQWVGRNGAPDRLVMLPGGFLAWVELKAPGEKPTVAQLREHEKMRAVGQTVVVLDSVDGVDAFMRDYCHAR